VLAVLAVRAVQAEQVVQVVQAVLEAPAGNSAAWLASLVRQANSL